MSQDQPKFASETPHFFKIILEETLQENKLRIPNKFVRKFGKTLSNSVTIKLPCGSEWKMKLENYGGKVWFGKGWPKFATHYSIVRGHMLVFRYQGNSQFNAFIFDTSMVEIDYPNVTAKFGEFDILKMKGKSPKRMKTCPTDEIRNNGPSCSEKIKLENSVVKEGLWNSKTEMAGNRDSPSKRDGDKSAVKRQLKSKNPRHLKTLKGRKKDAALEKASGFKSKRPFFKVVMQPSYIIGKRMHFPPDFVQRYLKGKPNSAILKVRDEKRRSWPVKYGFGVYNGVKVSRFQTGLKPFIQDNNLEVGDVCVFVLLKGKGISFEVVIFHANQNSKTSISRAHEGPKNDSDHSTLLKTIRPKQEENVGDTTQFAEEEIPRTILNLAVQETPN